jgi:D-arabinose 1-dehydrogenase-like Zn-dependent alcohol dehydrogenase
VILGTTNSAAQATECLRGLRPEGRFVSMGLVDGPIQADPGALLVGQLKIVGSRQDERRDLAEALELHAKGKAKGMLEISPLEKVNEVRERLEAGKVRYRSVLTL